MRTKYISCLLVVMATISSPLVQAEAIDGDEMDYDTIVDRLGSTTKSSLEDPDPLANVMIHTSLGLATSYVFIEPEFGPAKNGFLKGIEASFGIDLFSRHWLAEGSVRSFNNDRIDNRTEVGLKEFDLKFLYVGQAAKGMRLRAGAGLAARYMNILTVADAPITAQNNYTTPASIFFAGLAAQLTHNISIGTDLSLRTAMIKETVDKSSVNASLRLDAQF